MAARPAITGLKVITSSASFTLPTSHILRSRTRPAITTALNRPSYPTNLSAIRPFHNSTPLHRPEPIETAQHGEGDRNQSAELDDLLRPPPEPIDASQSAYLGEGDSNDGEELIREIAGNPLPSLDASQSAFLGESDSNDAFEGEKEVTGDTHEPLDASQAAFLGEGDSNDAFEGEKAVEGDKHEAIDPMISGF